MPVAAMLSLITYKFITALTQTRTDLLSADKIPDIDPIKTFPGSDFNIHILAGHDVCQRVLSDATFIQPGIADAITKVMGNHASALAALDVFLRNNPIQLDGSRHKTARSFFLREYKDALRAVGESLPSLADQAFANFIRRGSRRVTQDLTTPYVDSVLGSILSTHYGLNIDASAWCGDSSSIFEFFHAPKQLQAKSLQISKILKAVAGGPLATADSERIPVLLSYLLQGRDPLLGAFGAFIYRLPEIGEKKREQAVAQMTCRELFWKSAPVNYIGRTATRDVDISNVTMKRGDHLILMLPWASHRPERSADDSMAFGTGPHICGGQALALSIADAWLDALRHRYGEIDWRSIKRGKVVPAVFRIYRDENETGN
jgi:cytochrome P450